MTLSLVFCLLFYMPNRIMIDRIWCFHTFTMNDKMRLPHSVAKHSSLKWPLYRVNKMFADSEWFAFFPFEIILNKVFFLVFHNGIEKSIQNYLHSFWLNHISYGCWNPLKQKNLLIFQTWNRACNLAKNKHVLITFVLQLAEWQKNDIKYD